ncbi:MAG: 4Fe-4S binding protein, partial [Bacteroidota bacterium]
MIEDSKDGESFYDKIYEEVDPLITETGTSFRDKVSNIDRKGKRIWIYPQKPKGKMHSWRMATGYFIFIMFIILPFLKIKGQPAILLDVINRQFIIFGLAFWPQDFYIFALAFLSLAVFVILFTAGWGRIWCGWLCPQTVFMELVFRKIEYFFEGDAYEQKKLNTVGWTGIRFFKKTVKH